MDSQKPHRLPASNCQIVLLHNVARNFGSTIIQRRFPTQFSSFAVDFSDQQRSFRRRWTIVDGDVDFGSVRTIVVCGGDHVHAGIASQGSFDDETGHILRIVQSDSIRALDRLIFERPRDRGSRLANDWNVDIERLASANLDLLDGGSVDPWRH